MYRRRILFPAWLTAIPHVYHVRTFCYVLKYIFWGFWLGYVYAGYIITVVGVGCCSPLFYELACENTYPIGEGVTNGLLTWLNNVVGLTFLFILMSPGIGEYLRTRCECVDECVADAGSVTASFSCLVQSRMSLSWCSSSPLSPPGALLYCLMFTVALYKLPEAVCIRHSNFHIDILLFTTGMYKMYNVRTSDPQLDSTLSTFTSYLILSSASAPRPMLRPRPTATRHARWAGQRRTHWQCAQLSVVQRRKLFFVSFLSLHLVLIPFCGFADIFGEPLSAILRILSFCGIVCTHTN